MKAIQNLFSENYNSLFKKKSKKRYINGNFPMFINKKN